MTLFADDVANAGFDGDDMLDMQNRIGPLNSVKQRLSCVVVEPDSGIKGALKTPTGKTKDSLFGDLISSSQQTYLSRS